MNTWFRFYNQAIRDPKVLRLTDSDFRLWVGLLSVASEQGGHIPAVEDLKLILNRRLDHLLCGLKRLVKAELIDALTGDLTGCYEPHNWTKFQYKSDTSTPRVQRFRNSQRNIDETPPEPDTESDTEQSPQTPADGGHGSGHDVRALAQELCKRTGIGNAGVASIGQVGHWLTDGISASTIRAVVGEMASKGGGTRSLKRFDQPIRRAHAERKPNGANGRRYVPRTRDELERAVMLADERGWLDQAATYRAMLAGMSPPTTSGTT